MLRLFVTLFNQELYASIGRDKDGRLIALVRGWEAARNRDVIVPFNRSIPSATYNMIFFCTHF